MSHKRAFTLVELLIVIVVIAILAAIGFVAYSGVQTRAQNSMTLQAVATYAKADAMYVTTGGTGLYPNPTEGRCLVDTDNSNSCMRINSAASTNCFSMGTGLRNSTYETNVKINSGLAKVSAQTMMCNGLPYRGVFAHTAPDGKRVTYFVLLKGNIPTCPDISGVRYSARNQSEETTMCNYYSPDLP